MQANDIYITDTWLVVGIYIQMVVFNFKDNLEQYT